MWILDGKVCDGMLENLELNLLAGDAINTEAGKIIQPTIRNIIDIGDRQYNEHLAILLYDIDLVEGKEDIEKIIEIDNLTVFDFLMWQSIVNKDFRKMVVNGLEFFYKQPINLMENYWVFNVGEIFGQKFITRENYDYIRKVLIKVNYLKNLEEEEELEFGNEMAREWYMNIKKTERKQPKAKPPVNLHSLVSAMMWRTNKGVEEILNMTVYQLYDGYYRFFILDNALSLKKGMYSGMIDNSKVKPAELNWAKIIEFEQN